MLLPPSLATFLHGATTVQWIALAMTTTVASFLAAVAYRLVLHPLRQYPGPILCAVSSLPRTWQVISGNEHTFLYELHMKYGPAVRLGPNELSFIDAQAWKDIYGHRKAGKPEFTKDPSFFDASANGEQDIIRADKATHSRFRKVFSNSFCDRALKQQESLLKQHVNKLIRNLTDQAKKGSPVDMAKQYNFTTFDIMADLTFSESLGLLDGNDYNDWVRAIVNNWQFIVVMRMLKSYKKLFTIISRVLPKKWQEGRLKLFSYAVERVDRRLERGTTKSDIWDQMQQRDASITVSEMHANAEIFIIAGSETTATPLSGLTYYLLTNPDTMEKLKQEIRTACPTEEDITVERLQELKYLHACVEEGFRHYSPSVIGHVRIVPEKGAFVCGSWMPGGTKVSVPHYVAYHSPANFTRPHEFIPERWIDTDGEFASDKRDILQPFSYSPRNCISKNLAYHEIRVILASVLQKFDLKLRPECAHWNKQKVWVVYAKPALLCKLIPHRKE